MYSKILVPIAMDQLEQGERALTIAGGLLAPGGQITLLNVIEDMTAYAQGYMIVDFPFEMIEAARKHAQGVLEGLAAKISAPAHVALRTGGPAGTINAFVAEDKSDLVIVASHKPGLLDYVIGSTASRVVSHCPVSVLVVR